MGQVTIYLEDDIEAKMVASAKAMKVSKSKWISNVIREKLVDEWPSAVRELPGSWEDFPALEAIRDSAETDVDREEL